MIMKVENFTVIKLNFAQQVPSKAVGSLSSGQGILCLSQILTVDATFITLLQDPILPLIPLYFFKIYFHITLLHMWSTLCMPFSYQFSTLHAILLDLINWLLF
jgi:hypothetical protein